MIAKAISPSFLPTPAKTMSDGENPAISAFLNSPSETTSAPSPFSFIIFKIDRLELDFTEKHILTGRAEKALFILFI